MGADLRAAFRVFRASPWFWVPAVLTVALGIGVTSTTFGLVDGMLFRRLPYANPDQLYVLTPVDTKTGKNFGLVTEARMAAVRERHHGLSSLVVSQPSSEPLTLLDRDEPETLRPFEASPEYFDVLGVRPQLGRLTVGPTDTRPGLLVLSDGYWRRRFGADPGVVGRSLRSAEHGPVEVIGVLPVGFLYPGRNDALTPDAFWLKRIAPGARVAPIARLQPGASVQQANAELEMLVRGLADLDPATADGTTLRLLSLRQALFGSAARRQSLVLLGVGIFVLLVACANVASLLLARGVARSRDLAARVALGAGRVRLARLLLCESLVICGVSGLLAMAGGRFASRLLASQVPSRDFRFIATGLDLRVLAFSVVFTLFAALVAGLPAAVRHSRPRRSDALRRAATSTGGSAPRLGRVLVTTEVALALVLAAGAALLAKSFIRLHTVKLGFTPDSVLTIDVTLPRARYPDAAARSAFLDRLLDEVSHTPGVAAAAGAAGLPMRGGVAWKALEAANHSDLAREIGVWYVTSEYFRTLGLPLIQGRPFTEAESRAGTPVAVVNEEAARLLWPDGRALGRRVQDEGDLARDVVGIAADARRSFLYPPEPWIYVPPPAGPGAPARSSMGLVVRAETDPMLLAPVLRRRVRRIDSALPVTISRLRDAMEARELQAPRFLARLVGACAGLALAIAAVGIFGTVAYAAARRRHEIGVRVALGASPSQVRRLVVGQTLVPLGLGLVFGMGGALALARVLENQLFEVAPSDPAALACAALALAGVALMAGYIPAFRASRMDPLAALREE